MGKFGDDTNAGSGFGQTQQMKINSSGGGGDGSEPTPETIRRAQEIAQTAPAGSGPKCKFCIPHMQWMGSEQIKDDPTKSNRDRAIDYSRVALEFVHKAVSVGVCSECGPVVFQTALLAHAIRLVPDFEPHPHLGFRSAVIVCSELGRHIKGIAGTDERKAAIIYNAAYAELQRGPSYAGLEPYDTVRCKEVADK